MGLFGELFGWSKEKEVWQQWSREIGAEYVDCGFFQGCSVESRYRVWAITFDSYSVGSEDRTTYTRIRAPYVTTDGFWFKIYREGPLSPLGKKFLGTQDIEIGDAELDREFIIQGSDVERLAYLFRSPRIRSLIRAQPPGSTFEVSDVPNDFGVKLPKGVAGLRFVEEGFITDVERLKQLHALIAETLSHLCHMGSALNQDPGVTLGN